MNKNIIRVGLSLTFTVMSGLTTLTVPEFDFYSDNLSQKVKYTNRDFALTQRSLTAVGIKSIDFYSSTKLSSCEMNMLSSLKEREIEIALLESLVERMEECKPLPSDFSEIIDNNFWDLI